MYSDDYEYAHSRLAETIVRIDERAVFVHSVNEGMKVKFHYLDDKNEVVKTCLINKLNLKPVPLGYCNYNKRTTYLMRFPMRRDWRQGLRRGNFGSIGEIVADNIPYDVLAQVIQGVYPTFQKCVETIGKVKEMAWHRNWSLSSDSMIHYKGDKIVGKVVNGVIELDTRYEYLNEALKETL